MYKVIKSSNFIYLFYFIQSAYTTKSRHDKNHEAYWAAREQWKHKMSDIQNWMEKGLGIKEDFIFFVFFMYVHTLWQDKETVITIAECECVDILYSISIKSTFSICS